MAIDYEELLNLVAELCEERNLRAAASGSLRGGLIAGTSAVLGGILLGPVGLAVGGTVGGLAAAGTSRGSFKPVAQILLELPARKKEQLCLRLQKVFKDFGVNDLLAVGGLLLSNRSLQELAIREVMNYFQNNLSMSVKSG